MAVLVNKIVQSFQAKFRDIDWGKFVFYFSISGIVSILIVLLTYIYVSTTISGLPLSETNEIRQHPISVEIASVKVILIFTVIYMYSLFTMEKQKSWYRKSKKLFIVYPIMIIALLQFISKQSSPEHFAWWGVSFLVWLTCYMITETLLEIFEKKIIPTWKELPSKEKYSLVIPIITFILGYIFSK